MRWVFKYPNWCNRIVYLFTREWVSFTRPCHEQLTTTSTWTLTAMAVGKEDTTEGLHFPSRNCVILIYLVKEKATSVIYWTISALSTTSSCYLQLALISSSGVVLNQTQGKKERDKSVLWCWGWQQWVHLSWTDTQLLSYSGTRC